MHTEGSVVYFNIPKVVKYIDQYKHLQRLFENGSIDQYFSRLTARERVVIQKRVGFCDNNPKSCREIGELLGVSSERIRQIETKTLLKIYKDNPTRRDFIRFARCNRPMGLGVFE